MLQLFLIDHSNICIILYIPLRDESGRRRCHLLCL